MPSTKITRRDFIRDTAAVGIAAGLGAAQIVQAGNPTKPDTSKILNYNPDMEYRRCGKTGLMISAVALGGHWKRVDQGDRRRGAGRLDDDGHRPPRVPEEPRRGGQPLHRAGHQLRRRLLPRGNPGLRQGAQGPPRQDVLRLLLARQGKPLSRVAIGQEAASRAWTKGMKEAGLEYVDLWRISLLTDSSDHTEAEVDEAVAALDWAKKTGRARFIGVSSHDRAAPQEDASKSTRARWR